MSPIETHDPCTAVLQDFPFGAAGSVRSWQPVGGDTPGFLAAGVREYRGVFDWDLRCDAVYHMISGSLTVLDDEDEHIEEAGQVMSIPRGSKGRFVSAEGCRLFWAIFPGNWEQISELSINEPAL